MTTFCYQKAFCRNTGIITENEQERLRTCRVAIAGAGGMGGLYAEALTRLGVGSFAIADGDTFEMANANRQMGAIVPNEGKNKALGLKERILSINPSAVVDIWRENLDAGNIEAFVDKADIAMNAIEAFAVSSHRLLFSTARRQGVPVIFGAPLGFSGAVLAFDPHGMSADEYFDWFDGQDELVALAGFLVGTAPAALHIRQLNLKDINVASRTGPSVITACLAAGSFAVTEACRMLTRRHGAHYAPCYLQIDPYTRRIRTGVLRWGGRSPWQQLKRMLVVRKYRAIYDFGMETHVQNCRLPTLAEILQTVEAEKDA